MTKYTRANQTVDFTISGYYCSLSIS